MEWEAGTTVADARSRVSAFLLETGCYDVCSDCPLYPGGDGCCDGCQHLKKESDGETVGCSNQNLSCLSFTCGALNMHLLKQGKLEEFVLMTDGLPREGRRGCQRREDNQLLQISSATEVELVACVEFSQFPEGRNEIHERN